MMAGCKKGPELPMQILSVDKDAIIAPSMGSEYTLNVTSNTAWKVDWSSATWAVPSMVEFVGTSEMKLLVEANTGDERTTVIAITSEDGSVSREIKVVQSGVSSEGYISISALRLLEKEGESYRITGNSEKIRGFVVSDAISGNWFENSMAIEDSFTEQDSGINIEVSQGYQAFSSGEEISVPLEGAVLERNDAGYLTLVVGSLPERTDATPVTVKAIDVDYGDLSVGGYESMYVRAKDFQVVEESIGGVWSISPLFQNADDSRIKVNVSENASFASVSYNEGVGNISGIAGPEASIPDLWPARVSDIDLSTMRIGVNPGIRKLPYVFPFYCSEQTNEKPKYIRYNKLTYDSSAQLVTGVIAEDLDESKGVFLEMTVYGEASSNIYGPNYWAEQGAHDNINTSGFVSLDNGKTVPPAECGFWLTVPLQMDMPADFNVSFGLCGAGDWSLSDWAVSYSADKSVWYKAGEVRITRVTGNGSYYFYYTVPVHLEIPMLAESTLYLKLTPQGSRSVSGAETADGHGNSCRIRLHSAIVISQEVEGDTHVPAGAVYFQPFDKLTAGMDYFVGERMAAFANYCSDDISQWSEEQKQGLTGTNVKERPGYAQIGYVNTETPPSREDYADGYGKGVLETPVLGEAGDFRLSFKAAAYRSPAIRPNADTGTPDVGSPDITSIVVEVLGGGTIDGNASVVVGDLPTDSFKTYSLDITGATDQTRLRFTSAPEEGQFSRWFIDDILVTK